MANKIKGFRAFCVQVLLFSWAFLGNQPALFAQEAHDSVPVSETGAAEAHAHQSTAGEEGGRHEKFNAGKLIMEHIADAHEWHLFGHVHIPLPVILYTPQGIEVFSSSRLAEGQVYNGYKLEENHIKAVDAAGAINEEASAKIVDLSITKNVFSIFT